MGQAHDEPARRPPREDARDVAVATEHAGAAHPAQEQVQHPAEVEVRVVADLAPAQVTVQRHGIQHCLQRVVRVEHRLLHRLVAVVPGGQRLSPRREPVGLVVDDQVPLVIRFADADDGVDAAGQVAAERGRG